MSADSHSNNPQKPKSNGARRFTDVKPVQVRTTSPASATAKPPTDDVIEMDDSTVVEPIPDQPITSDEPNTSTKRHTKLIATLVIGGIILVLAAGSGAWWWYHKPANVSSVQPAASTKPKATKPTVYYSPLTGLPTTQSGASQPVVGVMIENLDPNARPQSGLGAAGVVYEALAEGGITRFLAIFQEPFPPVIGPVRSLRPYYLDWGLEYNIPVAHAGGSQPALAEVVPLGLKDINALEYDGSYFYRTTDRVAPHNLYTNASLLAQLDQKLGFAQAPTFTPLPRQSDKAESPATHPTINITFSTAGYNVQYQYDYATNSYARFMAGTAHIDRNTNQQIYVKNIVVEYTPTTYGTQPDTKPETDIDLIGTGKALVFENGGEENAIWSKSADNAPTKLTDASTGKPIKFNRGNIWYEIIPTVNSVTF